LLGAFGGVFCGAIVDRLGHRVMLLGGLWLLALVSSAGALVHDASLLLVLRIAEGLGFLAVAVAAPPLIVAATAQRDRRVALGWWGCYVPFGMAVVLFAAPPLVNAGGWRALWLATAAGAALLALVLPLALRHAPAPHAERASFVAQIGAVLGTPLPLVLAVAFGAYAGEYLALIGFLPTMIVESGRTVALAAVAAGFVAIGSGLGNLLGGVLTRVLPRWAIMSAGAIAMGIAAALAYDRALPILAREIAAVVATLVGGVIPASVMASVPIVSPSPRLIATTQGLAVQGSSAGQTVIPVVVAAIGGLRTGTNGSLAMLACSALTLVAALSLRPAEMRAPGAISRAKRLTSETSR
jgi:MFS family permease